MDNIKRFYEFLCGYKWGVRQIDAAHNCLVFATALSSKPEKALELGIGGGYVTRAILYALKYNGRGTLTSVDNWRDWKGKKPDHIEELEKLGLNAIVMDEGKFVRRQPDNYYDFLMSDGDHQRGGQWAEDVFRIVKSDGIMFFHDVSTEIYPSLKRYIKLSRERELPHFIFSKSSRDGEWCGRGLLMVQNRK